MITLAAIIDRFEAAYLTEYQHAMLPSYRQAPGAKKLCRSKITRRMLPQCTGCDEQRFGAHSCGHRNCPHCQHFESPRWIQRHTQRLAPGSYFLSTFTLPVELRAWAWQHPRTVYAKSMECAWQTLHTFSQNHRQWQGSPSALAVLHSHSRRLDFHPQVHVAMPAAALDADNGLWRTPRRSANGGGSYLFNHEL